jgi:hypothetical protein
LEIAPRARSQAWIRPRRLTDLDWRSRSGRAGMRRYFAFVSVCEVAALVQVSIMSAQHPARQMMNVRPAVPRVRGREVDDHRDAEPAQARRLRGSRLAASKKARSKRMQPVGGGGELRKGLIEPKRLQVWFRDGTMRRPRRLFLDFSSSLAFDAAFLLPDGLPGRSTTRNTRATRFAGDHLGADETQVQDLFPLVDRQGKPSVCKLTNSRPDCFTRQIQLVDQQWPGWWCGQ